MSNQKSQDDFTPTPHIAAKKGAFAETVLMPGDPLRAKFIAETFLENAELVNNVRGIQGYTGTYNGKRVSVMASGMGMPSIGIYSFELFNFFDVQNIIRVGSAGALSPDLSLRDIIIAKTALTHSSFQLNFGMSADYVPKASPELVEKAAKTAKTLNLNAYAATIYSTDVFYDGGIKSEYCKSHGAVAVEMEAAALYMNAYKAGKRALAVLTVSDSLVTGESLPALEREKSFTDMMRLALEMA